MPKSTNQANAVLNATLCGVPFPTSTSVYVALYNGDPRSGGVEISGGSYTRQQLFFNVATNALTNNTNLFTFSDMPEIHPPAAITHIAVCDAITGGSFSYVTPVIVDPVELGDTINGAAGTISIMET